MGDALLTDRDDEGGESVTTDDASVVHDVLRGDLSVTGKQDVSETVVIFRRKHGKKLR